MRNLTTTDHANLVGLLPDYALGRLGDADAQLIGAHLDSCPICRREFAVAVETLADLVIAPGPRSAVRTALLARTATGRAADSGRLDALAPAASPAGRSAVRRLSFGHGARVAVALAAALLIVLLAGWNLSLQRQLNDRGLPAEMFADPSAAHVLGESPLPQSATAVLYGIPGSNVGLLVAQDLPRLPADRRYQLWLIADGAAALGAGLFDVDDRGRGQLLFQAPEPLDRFAQVGVTVEPRTGSPAPTGPIVVGGSLTWGAG